MSDDFFFSTPVRRLTMLLSAPVWVPLLIATGVTILALWMVWSFTWSYPIQLLSWVLYGDHYVLGRWWSMNFQLAPVLCDDELDKIDLYTDQSRTKAGLPRRPAVF